MACGMDRNDESFLDVRNRLLHGDRDVSSRPAWTTRGMPSSHEIEKAELASIGSQQQAIVCEQKVLVSIAGDAAARWYEDNLVKYALLDARLRVRDVSSPLNFEGNIGQLKGKCVMSANIGQHKGKYPRPGSHLPERLLAVTVEAARLVALVDRVIGNEREDDRRGVVSRDRTFVPPVAAGSSSSVAASVGSYSVACPFDSSFPRSPSRLLDALGLEAVALTGGNRLSKRRDVQLKRR